MPAGVVDHFELIEVQVEQCVLGSVCAVVLDGSTQTGLEFPAVGQSCQRVVGRLVLQPCGQRSFMGDVTQHEDDADCVAVAITDGCCPLVDDYFCSVGSVQYDS